MHRLAEFSLLFLAALPLVACAQAPGSQAPGASEALATTTAVPEKTLARAPAAPIQPLAQKTFGAEITETTTTPLDALLRTPGSFSQKMVRTEGVVSAVCQSMGCWMELADTGGHAHIKMAGHRFFVPKDATGHRAVVQGKVLTAATAANPNGKDDCTQEAEQAMGSVAKLELEATGVAFVD